MANIGAVRDALIKLMRATEKGKATRPEDRAFRTQYESVGDYGEPTVREVVNQSPTKAGAIEKAMEGPAGDDPWGTFPADPDSAAIRAARGEANYVQGSDPLGNLDPHGSPRWQSKQSEIGDRISPLAKDPVRLPGARGRISDDKPPIDVPGTKQARQEMEEAGELQPGDVLTAVEMEEVGTQIFNELFPIVAKGEMPDARLLAQLEDTHPPLANYLKQQMKDQGLLTTSRDNPLVDDIDIPF